MRIPRGIILAVALVLIAAPAFAQDAETLRRELEQMRKQFQDVQQQYQKSIEALSERLQKLEERPQAVATPPAAAPPAIALQAPAAPPPSAPPSAMDLLRPREPFGLYGQRSGQLLFDIGLAGDFVANFAKESVERAGVGTFAGRENRFFPREIELSLFGQIDPYARAEVRIETGEEEAGGELAVHLAEANLTLLTLPWGTQAKLGQMRNRFGLLNQLHAHDLPQTDAPAVLRAFFGEEGLVERGVELTWVPDLPFYLEGLVGVFNGDNEAAFGRGRLRDPLVTARLRTFFELGNTGGLQIGASLATGATPDELRQYIVGFDAKYKYRPEGWLHPLLTVAGEGMWSRRKIKQSGEIIDDEGNVTLVERKVSLDRFGWYTYVEVQPFRRWAGGVRYDNTELLQDPGREWAVEPYLTFMPSEFLKFRLAYKHTNRSDSHPLAVALGRRSFDEILLQASFILGAHPAHPF
jgi:Sec-independent protein translocase protein TatA